MADEIRIVLADDHPIVLRGLILSIQDEENYKVVGQASDGESALALIRKHRPDVAIVDVDMPKLDGFGVAREAAKLRSETKIIFLTLHADQDMFRAAMDAGAKGYLVKDSALNEIVAAIEAVAAGRVYVGSAVATKLLEKAPPPKPVAEDPILARLTPTEREVLRLIGDGKSSKEIGEDLSIHYRTVENHRTNICRKIGIEGSNALLRFALQQKAAK